MMYYFILSFPNPYWLEVCMQSIIVKKYNSTLHFSFQYSWTVSISFSIFKEYINLKYPSIQSQFGMTDIAFPQPQPQTLVSWFGVLCVGWNL